MTIVSILGAGVMGSAMAWPLAENGHDVRLVGTHLDGAIIDALRTTRIHPKHQRPLPETVKVYPLEGLAEAMQGAELLICGVSSPGVDWFVETSLPYLKPEMPVLMITKGLCSDEQGNLKIFPQRMNELLPEGLRDRISINAVAGPVIAQELSAHRQTCVNYCGEDLKVLHWLKGLLQTGYYHIYPTTDLIGAEFGVAMKNAYAIAINFPAGEFQLKGQDGPACMYNPQAALFAQSMFEIARLARFYGGQVDGLLALTGPGDLFVTVFGGRNSGLGKLLGQGHGFDEAVDKMNHVTLEGVNIMLTVVEALQKLEDRQILSTTDFPLLMHLYEVVHDGKAVNIPWETFFQSKMRFQ